MQKEFVMKYILNDLENKKLFLIARLSLQEIVQSEYKEGIRYEMIGESGPITTKLSNMQYISEKRGLEWEQEERKKAAEQSAAYESILKLRAKRKVGEICI